MRKGTFPVTTTLCLKTELQATVGALLHHPQTCWIPQSASKGARGASEKLLWYLRQAKGELSALPRAALPGAQRSCGNSVLGGLQNSVG